MGAHSSIQQLRRRTGIAGLVLLALVARAWIPVGFMPAAIAEGGPLAICHGGAVGAFFRSLEAARRDSVIEHAAHSAHDGVAGHEVEAAGAEPAADPAAEHEGWEHCPFGAAFGAALVAADFDAGLLTPGHALEPGAARIPVPFRPAASYRARAPPVPTIRV